MFVDFNICNETQSKAVMVCVCVSVCPSRYISRFAFLESANCTKAITLFVRQQILFPSIVLI